MVLRHAGERRLVDAERHGLEESAVGRHLIAGIDDDNIAHHHIFAWHLGGLTVAYHLHGLVVVHLIENGELSVGLQLEVESHAGGQDDGNEDADWLEEHTGVFAQTPVLIARNKHGKHTGHKENNHQRVGELTEEALQKRLFFGRREHIDAVLGTAAQHLLLRKPVKFSVIAHK